jgi:lysyl-tRNA synthetase class I
MAKTTIEIDIPDGYELVKAIPDGSVMWRNIGDGKMTWKTNIAIVASKLPVYREPTVEDLWKEVEVSAEYSLQWLKKILVGIKPEGSPYKWITINTKEDSQSLGSWTHARIRDDG